MEYNDCDWIVKQWNVHGWDLSIQNSHLCRSKLELQWQHILPSSQGCSFALFTSLSIQKLQIIGYLLGWQQQGCPCKASWMADSSTVHQVPSPMVMPHSHSHITNGFLLEFPHGVCQALHTVIVVPGRLLGPCQATFGWYRHKLAAYLTENIDGVVVVVVPDEMLRLVGGVADNVLRHMHASSVCVLGLDRVLPVASHPSDWIPENQLLKPPLTANKCSVRIVDLSDIPLTNVTEVIQLVQEEHSKICTLHYKN